MSNLEAAMHHEADNIEPTINGAVGTPGNPATKQTIVRSTEHDHTRWKQAAERQGISLAEYIRGCCNERAATILDCHHPLNQRRYYPWAEFCLNCGQRLRG